MWPLEGKNLNKTIAQIVIESVVSDPIYTNQKEKSPTEMMLEKRFQSFLTVWIIVKLDLDLWIHGKVGTEPIYNKISVQA